MDNPPTLNYVTPAIPPSRRRWIVVAGVLIVLFLFGIFILLSSWNASLRSAFRVECASNLSQIGRAIILYANDHAGHYPDSFQTVLLNEDITPECFVCPESSDSAAPGPTTQAIAKSLTTGGHLSYVYLGRGLTDKTTSANAVIAYEPLSHHANGMNVLFGDGHVEFIDAKAGANLMAKVAAGNFPVTMPVQP